MKTKAVSVFQSAQDNWPEDEAHAVCDNLLANLKDAIAAGDASDAAWLRECLSRDLERMRGILGRESDGAQLVARFNAKAAELIAAAGVTI